MGLRIAYSYYYARASSPPPGWFSDYMREYLEDFLPAYYSKYLHADVSVSPAAFAASLPQRQPDWVHYFRALRDQVTWGEDMMMVITDLPAQVVNPACSCAGENFFLAKPNWGWCEMRSWEEVSDIRKQYPETAYAYDDWLAMQLGAPSDVGIKALAVVGHEITHYVLLRQGGPDESLRIDGGDLSGLTFMDRGLNPVSKVNYIPPNFHYAVQRVTPELPCVSPIGAYRCGGGGFGFY
jgi:hypothetical protein